MGDAIRWMSPRRHPPRSAGHAAHRSGADRAVRRASLGGESAGTGPHRRRPGDGRGVLAGPLAPAGRPTFAVVVVIEDSNNLAEAEQVGRSLLRNVLAINEES